MRRPLWIDPEEQTHQSVTRDLDVDVAIVGGGLSGLGAAWALQDSGASVALLESRTLASAASGRNAGFVFAGPASSYHDAVSLIGLRAALEEWQFTRANNRAISRIVEEFGIQCGYVRRGSMSLAVSDEEMAGLCSSHDLLERSGIATCPLEVADLPCPFDRMYFGGLYFPGNAEINPGLFVRGVGSLVADRIRIFERSPVTSLMRHGGWRLETPGGAVRAATTILCTNAYTGRLLSGIPISPTRGQVLATGPLPRVVVPFPMSANHGYQYWRQTPDGRLVVGGWRDTDSATEIGYQEELNPGIQDELTHFATRIAGGAVHVETRWAGIMGFTPDVRPLVGPVPGEPELYIAAGYSGHGVAMAFACGGEVARTAVGLPSIVPDVFSPARFASGGDAVPVFDTVSSGQLQRPSLACSRVPLSPVGPRATRR